MSGIIFIVPMKGKYHAIQIKKIGTPSGRLSIKYSGLQLSEICGCKHNLQTRLKNSCWSVCDFLLIIKDILN